jgi:hypothetical protein
VFEVGREEMGEDDRFDISGLSFASGADLLVGQDVQMRPGTHLFQRRPDDGHHRLGALVTFPGHRDGANIDSQTGIFRLTRLSPLFARCHAADKRSTS